MRRPAPRYVAAACLLLAAGVGLSLGVIAAPTRADAARAQARALKASTETATHHAYRSAWQEGHADGTRDGQAAGKKAGRTAGIPVGLKQGLGRVYVGSGYDGPKYRPGTIPFGNAQPINDVRWTDYGGLTATAQGVLPADDCNPNCASGVTTYFPVAIVASRLGNCSGLLSYLSISYRYTRKMPAGATRTGGVDLGADCKLAQTHVSPPPPVVYVAPSPVAATPGVGEPGCDGEYDNITGSPTKKCCEQSGQSWEVSVQTGRPDCFGPGYENT